MNGNKSMNTSVKSTLGGDRVPNFAIVWSVTAILEKLVEKIVL